MLFLGNRISGFFLVKKIVFFFILFILLLKLTGIHHVQEKIHPSLKKVFI